MDFTTVQKNLKERGFAVSTFATAKEAADYLNAQIDRSSVSFGGSMTLSQMGLFESLGAHNTMYSHWNVPDGMNAEEVLRNASTCENYLLSANGLAETGEIINIDGTGNRVAAMLYGHEALYIIAGTNKLAPDLPSAMERARNIAAPLNARRLSCKTPCAMSEPMRCHDCGSPDRICNGFVTLARPCGGIGKTHVILIEENLGY